MIATALLIAGLVLGQGAGLAPAAPLDMQGGPPLSEQGPVRDETAQPTTSDAGAAEPSGVPESSGASDIFRAPVASEWIVGAGAAKSVALFHSRRGIRYAVQTVSWARELTGDHGRGVLRGRLAWAVEVMPVLVESSPSRVYGFGVSPIGLRWNLVPRRRWSAFTELSGGLLGSSAAIPDRVARFNFTAHLGAGVRLPVVSHRDIVVAYRFQHISNGNRLPDNPGANSHVVFMGLSLTRRR